MRTAAGLAVLGIGTLGLGWWAWAEYAPFIETHVRTGAMAVAAGSVHGVTVEVSGRDITARGLADGPAEHDRLIAALNALRGRRVVDDGLEVLPFADPFVLQVERRDGVLIGRGSVPTEAARAALGLDGVTVAAGVPDSQWMAAVEAGIGGLRALQSGRFELSGRSLTLLGVAPTPVEEEAAHAAVAAELPEGYEGVLTIDLLDDGTPPAYQVHYTAAGGPWVEGKLPRGVSAGDVAAALGLDDIDDGARVALMGETGAVSPVLAALRPWLAEVETLDVSVAPDATVVEAGFGAGADMDLLGAALGADLARAAQGLSLRLRQVAAEGDEGARRINALSGQAEVLQGGFWLPAADFEPAAASCAAGADAVLAANRIGFVTGSARLDARARGAVNALAGVLGPCLQSGLRAEIGGHTDATGSDEANLSLSRERAGAVRAALVARGVPAGGLTAEGYGASQPVADNATEAGRAANRRTAVRWID